MAACDDTGVSIWSDTTTSSTAGQRNYRVIIPNGETLDPGCTPTQVRVKVKADSSTLYLNGISIGEQSGSTVNFASAPTRLLWSGSSTKVFSASEEAWTDWADFVIDPATDYLIHLTCNDATYNTIAYKSKTNAAFRKATSDDDTLVQSPTGYTQVSFFYGIIDIEVRGPAASTTTTTTVSTTTSSTSSTTTSTTESATTTTITESTTTTTSTTSTSSTTTTSTSSTTTTTTGPGGEVEQPNTVFVICSIG